jgi:RNA polymerase sigma-70 factor, ECF subfamily
MIFNRRNDSVRHENTSDAGALYDQHAPRLLSICMRYTGNREDAEDVLHDGFMKIIRNIGTFSKRHDHSLEAWMKRIIVNTALNYLRDHKKEKFFRSLESEHTVFQVAEEESEESFSGFNLSKDELMRMVCELPSGYRTVFNLYVIERHSHKEIAQMLACSENTSKSQLSKARAHLRKRLEELKEHESKFEQAGSRR